MFGSAIEPIKALREATDDLTSRDLDRLFDDQLTTLVTELATLRTRLEAVYLAGVGELDRRDVVDEDGYTSTSAWLADRCRLSFGQARSQVSLAAALEEMPETRAAFAVGGIDVARVRALAAAWADDPELFARDEEVLVAATRSLSIRHSRTAIDRWRQAVAPERFADGAEELYRRRRLHISETFGGLVHLEGDLDPEGGAVIATALHSITDRQARDGDERTRPQRRCDAMVEVCRSFLDHAPTPTTGGERPHLAVIVDVAVITGTGPGRCELDSGTVIPVEMVRRIACDATVTRLVTDGPSQILDVGRATRTVPTATRRALDIRDRGCTWAGCDRPARFCDAHHIWHWADGGPTNLENLTLLCRPHHRMTHEGRRAPP